MEMQPGELIDKYTIAMLCIGKLGKDREGIKELEKGVKCLRKKYPDVPWDDLIEIAHKINGFIWDFEEPIHLGRLDEEPIMAGILSIRVRKLNVVRVGLSRLINKLVEKDSK